MGTGGSRTPESGENPGFSGTTEGLSIQALDVELARLALAFGADLAVVANAPLAPLVTFRIGGPAQRLVEVGQVEALRAALSAARRAGVPVHLLGQGSNVLFPDQGMGGVVLALGGSLAQVRIEGETVVAGAAVSLAQLALRTTRLGLLGIEALTGFPSSVGGAVVMNAGCYGTEIKDVLTGARVLLPDGTLRDFGVADLAPGYRTTALQGTGAVVVEATLRLRRGDGPAALQRIKEWNTKRWASLPSGKPNAGSIFRNPPGDFAGRLIELCGLKGARAGGAGISDRHANVIVNLDHARADDVLALMVRAHGAVWARFGVALEPEVVLAGSLAPRFAAAIKQDRA